MAIDYAKAAATAAKAIRANGKPLSLIRGSGASFDPGSGFKTGETPNSFVGSCIETEFSLSLLASGVVSNNAKRLLAVDIPAPVVGDDQIMVDGGTWTLLKAMPFSPGSVTIYYELWVQ